MQVKSRSAAIAEMAVIPLRLLEALVLLLVSSATAHARVPSPPSSPASIDDCRVLRAAHSAESTARNQALRQCVGACNEPVKELFEAVSRHRSEQEVCLRNARQNVRDQVASFSKAMTDTLKSRTDSMASGAAKNMADWALKKYASVGAARLLGDVLKLRGQVQTARSIYDLATGSAPVEARVHAFAGLLMRTGHSEAAELARAAAHFTIDLNAKFLRELSRSMSDARAVDQSALSAIDASGSLIGSIEIQLRSRYLQEGQAFYSYVEAFSERFNKELSEAAENLLAAWQRGQSAGVDDLVDEMLNDRDRGTSAGSGGGGSASGTAPPASWSDRLPRTQPPRAE